MREPAFDIFSRPTERHSTWLARERTFGRAFDRMKEMATAKPGRYFLYCRTNQRVLVELEMPLSSRTKRAEPKIEWRF
jgi:hypothetical protein